MTGHRIIAEQIARAPQRGVAALAYLVAAAVVIGALAGLYSLVEGRGYERGAAKKQKEWDEANRAAVEQRERERLAVAQALLAAERQRLAAEQAADAHRANWERDRREARRLGTRLVACAPAVDAVAAAGGADPRGGGGRVTWQFVREYDAAWSGDGGQPVFPAAGGAGSPEPAEAASRYGLDDVLDVHGDNAESCGKDRRNYARLRARIEAAGNAVEAARQ